jgi:hypothetical protein
MDQTQTTELNMRLTKLEESYFSLSAHLEGERVLRKVEDDKCRQICDFLAKQIIEIKEKQPNESFNEVFLSLKEELINSIDRKIDSKILENKKQLELQYINNIEKINKNKAMDTLDSKKIDTEFNQYRYELNNINKKLEEINKIYDTKIKDMSKELENIHNTNNSNILEKSDLISKINDLNEVLNKLEIGQKNELVKIKNNIKEELDIMNNNIESKINNIHIKNINNEHKNNNYDYDLNNIDNNLSLLKSDFDSLSSNYLKEINELKKFLNKQNNLKNKEISNFEQHFLEEYENFTKFITDILNQNVDKLKSMNDYMNSDIEIIKNKNAYLEETLLKLRTDIYDSLENNVKYVLDKIHSYFDVQSESGKMSSNNDNNDGIENNQKKEINVNEE